MGSAVAAVMKAQPIAPGKARVDMKIRYSGGGRVDLSSVRANERAALLAFKIIISGECDISSVAKLVTEVNDAFDKMPDQSESSDIALLQMREVGR